MNMHVLQAWKESFLPTFDLKPFKIFGLSVGKWLSRFWWLIVICAALVYLIGTISLEYTPRAELESISFIIFLFVIPIFWSLMLTVRSVAFNLPATYLSYTLQFLWFICFLILFISIFMAFIYILPSPCILIEIILFINKTLYDPIKPLFEHARDVQNEVIFVIKLGVQNLLDSIINQTVNFDFSEDDIDLCLEEGLIARKERRLVIANPIYEEMLPKALMEAKTYYAQEIFDKTIHVWGC